MIPSFVSGRSNEATCLDATGKESNMRASVYVCLAAIATVLAGCLWVPGEGYRGDRNGGMAVRMAAVTKADGIEATLRATT